ncbi:SRPBCC family protein [Paracoccaceae bacterium GXU_MW_L88]
MITFKTETPVAAPATFTFSRLSDFDRLGTLLATRGITMEPRLDGADGTPRWFLSGDYRGRQIESELILRERVAPERMQLESRASGFLIAATLTLEPNAAEACVIRSTVEVTPQSIKARLFESPLRLAQTRLNARLADNMGRLAKRIEADYKPAA